MKRLFIFFATIPILLCGCASFEEQDTAIIIPTAQDLQAGFAEDTRTYVENGKYLRWHEDDRLTAFYGNTLNRQYKFKGKTGANSGTFSLVPSGELGTGNALDRIYAVYPYNEMVEITDEGKISLILPAVQSYAENSFGRGANTMIAITENLEDTFLAFKNACGYLKLKLYGNNVTITSIEIRGNNNEKIAGAATATIAFGEAPQLTMADEATTSVTIDCGEGVALGATAETATEFWVVLPETTFTKGLTIKATNTAGGVFEKSTDKEVVITRNEILPMAAVKVECINNMPSIPNNEIWYTTTDGEMAELAYAVTNNIKPAPTQSYRDDIGCYVVTFSEECYGSSGLTNPCGFSLFDDNSKNKIKTLQFSNGDRLFDNFINDVGAWEASEMTSLEEINIPDNVTYIRERLFSYLFDLKRVIIGSNVTSIEAGAFEGCRGITSITLPENLESIGSLALWNTSITELIIPDKVQTLYTGNVPRSVVSLTIGYSVTNLKEDVWTTRDLSVVYCKPTTPPDNLKYLFYEINRDMTVYVPTNSIDAYRTILDQYDRVTVEEYDF